jgi:GDP-L-fucose synthase
MKKESTILVVGHDDIIDRSLVSTLRSRGFLNVIASAEIALDTTIQTMVYRFFARHKPEYVFLGSVRSGGIEANQKYPAEFFYANSESQNNVVYAAHKFGTRKLMYLASSCVYPKEAAQPMNVESLMTGPVEKTSQSYAMAKLAGINLCQAFHQQYGLNVVVVIPATVYGPQADMQLETAHVISALIKKFYDAKKQGLPSVTIWGTGKARREFIFADDFADGCLSLMEHDQRQAVLNLGCGEDIAIDDLAELVKDISGFSGKIVFDATKPDGAMRKLLNSAQIRRAGWSPRVSIREGLEKTWAWYAQEQGKEKSI